jgi:hypothetical protein
MNLLLYGFAIVTLLLGFVILKQGLSRKVELLSMRNLYLFGFCIYQLVSPALALHTENYWFFRIANPQQTGKAFLLLAILYLIVFFFSYHKLKITPWMASKLSGPPREVNDYLLMCLAVALIAIAIPLRFMPIASISKPSLQVAVALVGIACVIAGWVWSNNRANLAIGVVVGLIVSIAIVLSITSTFGRRPLIGVALGFVWGAYYRRVLWIKPAKLIRFMIPLTLAAAAIVSAFTAVRGSIRGESASAAATLSRLRRANVQAGAADILGGQACGSASLWAIEQWPDRFDTKPLYSLKFMAYWYVPRFVWPGKPAPLGNDVARLAKIKGVNPDRITIRPGVIGYAQAEGGTKAVIVYALFFGQFLRFFDELVRLNPTNTYIVLPAGCCIAQVVGLARGCIAIFSNVMILSFISTFLVLYIANKVFGQRLRQSYTVPWPQYR